MAPIIYNGYSNEMLDKVCQSSERRKFMIQYVLKRIEKPNVEALTEEAKKAWKLRESCWKDLPTRDFIHMLNFICAILKNGSTRIGKTIFPPSALSA